ncbi:MAG TPA: helix-turn-helix transcriptional regulator [Alphaproteobacteria bacterium]
MASYLFLSAAQCRAARGLLGWTQQDLAQATGLSKTAIVQFETGLSRARDETLALITMSLIKQGIEFSLPDGVNRRAATSQLFADEGALHEEWPAFLRSFGSVELIQLINWTDFPHEFTTITDHRPKVEQLQAAPCQKGALIGDWLILPLLDTRFRVAVHTAQWRQHIKTD